MTASNNYSNNYSVFIVSNFVSLTPLEKEVQGNALVNLELPLVDNLLDEDGNFDLESVDSYIDTVVDFLNNKNNDITSKYAIVEKFKNRKIIGTLKKQKIFFDTVGVIKDEESNTYEAVVSVVLEAVEKY